MFKFAIYVYFLIVTTAIIDSFLMVFLKLNTLEVIVFNFATGLLVFLVFLFFDIRRKSFEEYKTRKKRWYMFELLSFL